MASRTSRILRRQGRLGAIWIGGWLLALGPVAAQQEEALYQRIEQVALTQSELPAGWTLLPERVADSYDYQVSALISLVNTMPEMASVRAGHAVQMPEGAFNIDYFAFVRADGAASAEGYFKDAARKNNWLTFRLGDVILVALTDNQAAQAAIAQMRLVPFLEKLLAESIAAEQAGNIAAAEQGYFAIVQTAPVYARAWLRLGTIYQRASPPNLNAARDAYGKAVSAHKASPSLNDNDLWQAMLGLGSTTLVSGNPDAAIPILEEARQLGGRLSGEYEAKSDYFLATAYAAKQDEDKFLDYLEAAFEIQKSEGKRELLERAKTDPGFAAFQDKKKFKKLLKKYGKD